jgi:hypothetical protein
VYLAHPTNISSLIKVAFHQTTLLACVTILLRPIQISKLSKLILTICRVISICLYWGPFQTVYNHLVNYQAISGCHNSCLCFVQILRECHRHFCFTLNHYTQIGKGGRGTDPQLAIVGAQSTPFGKNVSLLSNVGFGSLIRRGSHHQQSFVEQGGK